MHTRPNDVFIWLQRQWLKRNSQHTDINLSQADASRQTEPRLVDELNGTVMRTCVGASIHTYMHSLVHTYTHNACHFVFVCMCRQTYPSVSLSLIQTRLH